MAATMAFRRLGKSGPMVSACGLGCMGLSLKGRPTEEESVAVLHAALRAGITFFDTADVYCIDDDDIGHNERLLKRALATYDGGELEAGRVPITIASKGIMGRPGGKWVPGSDPDALLRACDRSLENLGMDQIPLYYLHSPSALESHGDFLRAVEILEGLRQEGKIGHIGLSNVSLQQLEAAQQVCTVAAVQNKSNVFETGHFRDGLLGLCKDTGVAFAPYAPVGGLRGHTEAAGREELRDVSERLGCTPHEVMLSWLLQIDDCIIPLPGATRTASVESIARAATLQYELQDEEIVRLFHSSASSASE